MRKDKAEADVDPDEARADSRETGGVPEPDASDEGSTTGGTPDETYVGRVAGQDSGYEEETGAEARAQS
jgi:hypothetical protein